MEVRAAANVSKTGMRSGEVDENASTASLGVWKWRFFKFYEFHQP